MSGRRPAKHVRPQAGNVRSSNELAGRKSGQQLSRFQCCEFQSPGIRTFSRSLLSALPLSWTGVVQKAAGQVACNIKRRDVHWGSFVSELPPLRWRFNSCVRNLKYRSEFKSQVVTVLLRYAMLDRLQFKVDVTSMDQHCTQVRGRKNTCSFRNKCSWSQTYNGPLCPLGENRRLRRAIVRVLLPSSVADPRRPHEWPPPDEKRRQRLKSHRILDANHIGNIDQAPWPSGRVDHGQLAEVAAGQRFNRDRNLRAAGDGYRITGHHV